MEINEVYEKYNEYVMRTINTIINKKYSGKFPAIAPSYDDLEQEVWELISQQLHRYDPAKASIKTFICLITKSKISMLFKKDNNNKNKTMKTCLYYQSETETDDNSCFIDFFADNTDLHAKFENKETIKEIFSILSAEEIMYIKLHIIQKRPLKEINEILEWHVSKASLNTKSSRIFKKIKQKVINSKIKI